MKKLLMMLSVAVAAVSLNAASVKWSSGTIKLASGATGSSAGQVTATLWEFTSSTMYEKVIAGGYDVLANQAELDSSASAKLTGSSTKRGMLDITGTTDVAADKGVWAVILYTDTTATGADKYTVNAAYSGEVGSTGVTVSDLANYQGGSIALTPQGSAISGWTSTATYAPEPTSGLLLLLGVAGLALKRKHA